MYVNSGLWSYVHTSNQMYICKYAFIDAKPVLLTLSRSTAELFINNYSTFANRLQPLLTQVHIYVY